MDSDDEWDTRELMLFFSESEDSTGSTCNDWGSGNIVNFYTPSAHPFLSDKLSHGLEEVDVES